jgi:hypothetical protein
MFKLKNFPALSGNQVALLRAENSTGHILDRDFKLYTSSNQEKFTVFESLSNAVDYIQIYQSKYINAEFVVYDSLGTVIYTHFPK